MATTVALYSRSSTSKQTESVPTQLDMLRQWCDVRGYEAVEYVDDGISGTKESRPALGAMLADARRGKVSMIAVTELTRLGRSLQHLVTLADEMQELGIGLYSSREAIDTSSASGRLMFGVIASLAEFERERLSERTIAGLQRARSQGKTLGRPKVAKDKEDKARRQLELGASISQAAKHAGCGKSVAARIKKAMQSDVEGFTLNN